MIYNNNYEEDYNDDIEDNEVYNNYIENNEVENKDK